jgi:hypothetical protein
MTRLTALRITADDPDLCVSAYGPVEGKFGVYIGTVDHAPSGWPRPRILLTSDAVYETADIATEAANRIVEEAKSFLSPEASA